VRVVDWLLDLAAINPQIVELAESPGAGRGLRRTSMPVLGGDELFCPRSD